MAKYGFLGLGIMGGAMAANLLRAGFEVVVWNRNPERCAPLLALGARQGKNPAAVAAACDITFAMLSDPAAAIEVCFGADGVLAGIGGGRGYIDVSTVDDHTARRIAAAVGERGGRFLEAPVSGTKKPAEDGTLIFLAGGDQGLYDEALPALAVMGKKSHYLGAVGQGARMKLVVNMIMGGMMTALCEGLALGCKAGLPGERILEVLDEGALANPMFRGKGPMLLQEEYPVSFPLKYMQKDLRLALLLGDELRQSLPGGAIANETFKRACAAGLGEDDLTAVFEVVK